MRDTETLFALPTDGALKVAILAPGNDAQRLGLYARMYERYHVVSMSFTYVPMVSYTDATGFAMGYRAGPNIAAIKSMDTILRLKPSVGGHSSVTRRVTIADPMPSKWLGVNDAMGCLYVLGPKSGYIQITYHVLFDSPQPV